MKQCATMPRPLLDIRDLTFTAGEETTLKRLRLAIQAQKIHALLGANGPRHSAPACFLFVRMALVLPASCIEGLLPIEWVRNG
jgi:ABC-type phosphate transport system ATPase subunit